MAISEEVYLLECWDKGICPYCRSAFPASKRVGSGSRKQGGFCSLSCYAEYHKLSLEQRHQRRLSPPGKENG